MWQRVRSCREAASAALGGDGRTVSEFDYGVLLSKEVSAILNEMENICHFEVFVHRICTCTTLLVLFAPALPRIH